ncbi:putative myosin light chain kinase [Colletotrichum spinosum]|uniref:Putative myosin light chain kinase n=1 Tax=Colletotrichum spinosum TaxID=1347390 RepID=A0A4R8QU74_9PEZI|nr:putative myosin light chain kinase [Colletotrichum spinosum]
MVRNASLQDLNDFRNRFVPQGELKQLLDHEKIRELLLVLLDPQLHDEIDGFARIVSPSARHHCRCGNTLCTGMRILFVALVALSKEELLVHLCASAIMCDSAWPLEKTADEPDLEEPLLRMWRAFTDHEKEVFTQVQWQMRSPHLKRTSQTEISQSFDDEVSLPWVHLDNDKRSSDGTIQVSFVRKIKIHGSHHELESQGTSFALKVLEKRKLPHYTSKWFKREIKANQKASHPHITPLLAAFTHRSDFFLVLPWASGGNLQEMWEAYAPFGNAKLPGKKPSWLSAEWMAEQCFLIADAMATIHGHPSYMGGQCSAKQVHADIKPENILCFGSWDGEGPFSLKIADFGHSIPYNEHEPSTGIKGEPKTYRPPDDCKAAGLEWDIWTLACLYIDFITWAVLGSTGIDRFGEDRLAEITDANELDMEEDVFFRVQPIKPKWWRLTQKPQRVSVRVKDSVNSHLSYLRSHESCTQYLSSFLDYIETNMLLINMNQRATSAQVLERLYQLLLEVKGQEMRASSVV